MKPDHKLLYTTICEYAPLADATDHDTAAALSADHDWTPDGANTIVELARDYGSFILRHALALAVVKGRVDGELGL